MFATLYNKVSRGGRRLAASVALVALTTSSLVALEPPPPAAAAIVTNNLVLNLDGNNTTSLAATSPTVWNSISPGSSTAAGTISGGTRFNATGTNGLTLTTSQSVAFGTGVGRTPGDMTFDTWIRPGNLNLSWNIIASRWFTGPTDGGSAANSDWVLALVGSGTTAKLHLETTSNRNVGIDGNTAFPLTSANKWYHVGFTIDSVTGKAQLFVNGQTDSSAVIATHTDQANSQVWLGEGRNGQVAGASMVVSQARLYNAALTPAQMAQNYLTHSATYGYAPTNTVAPTSTGIARVGTVLSATVGTWGVGDADGTTTAYQWQTSTGIASWTDISGATNATYTPVAGDATNFLRVRVTKTNTAGSVAAFSESTARIQTAAGTALVSGGKLTGLTTTVPNESTVYNVTLATNNLSATMQLGTTTGLTVVTGYASTASQMASAIGSAAPIISFRGAGTAINTALANITYTSATIQTDVVKLYYATAGTTATDTIDYIPIYDNGVLKFHYYAYKVQPAGKNRAEQDASLIGLTTTDNVQAPGPWYLTTPRYQVEWERIKLIVGQNQAFMGARADAGSTNWYWPANTDGYTPATIFGTQSGNTVTATSNIYNRTNTTLPFHTGEPNAGTAVGRSGYFYISNSALGWDDVPLDASIPSFVMETFGAAPFSSPAAGALAQTVKVVASYADAPTNFTATATGTGSLVATWDATSANTTGSSVGGNRVEYSTSPTFTTPSFVAVGGTDTTAHITGLTANTQYYVRVIPITTAGWGTPSAGISVTTTSSATSITVVASGGGVAGTDYSIVKGFIVSKSGGNVNINSSDIQTSLATTGTVLAADNVSISAPITWATGTYLKLGNGTSSTVAINKTITASANNSQLIIASSTYSLDVKSGASVQLTSAGTQYLNIGGVAYTLIKTEAQLVAAAATTNYALAKPLTLATSYTSSPIPLSFTGTLDGFGNTIDSMKIGATTTERIGLIESLATGGVVRNLGVTNANITLSSSNYRAGVIAGGSTGGTINQVWSTGFIRTTTTNTWLALGGLVGNAQSGTLNISKSWSSVNIDSTTSGSSTRLEQGGIIGGNEIDVGQTFSLGGGSINLSQVYSTGNLKWGSNGHRGIGGLMGLHYANATTTITDAFSWVTFASGVPAYNEGGIIGVAAGGTSTATRTYQTTASGCVAGGGTGFTATPNCDTMRTPGETVSGMTGSNWATSGASVLSNLAAPAKPLYVQVVAPTDGSYSTVTYQIVDSFGAVQNIAALSAMNLSVSGTPVYKAAGVVVNGSSAKATYSTYYDSGLTLSGSASSYYSLNPWRDNTSVTISKYPQTITWAPTTSVSFGSGTFTPSPAPVASGGTAVSYSVSSAGTTGCTVNSSTGAITYTSGGSCAITATAASAGDWLVATDTETFVIAEPATAPTGLAATTAGSGMLNIGWVTPTVSSSAAITGYIVTYSTNAGMTSPTTVNVGKTTGYLLTGLTAGTVYYFQTRAVSGSTWTGPLSTIASATPNSTATTINVVASGGGVAGTDFTINGGVISTTGTASINASVIAAVLATEGTVQLAASTVNVNAAISWSSNSVLVLGNRSAATVNVNSQIAGSGATAGVRILPTSYGLAVKSGSYIRLTGATPSFNLGGTSYTVVNTVAGLSSVTASSTWALTAPIVLTGVYTSSVLNMNFAGTMDGLGNTISNLQIVATAVVNSGFYNNLAGATVLNIGFTNVNISATTDGATTRLGAAAGNGSSTGTNNVSQVWATGFISQTSSATNTATEAGGLFGGATGGTLNISKSWSSVAISTKAPSVGSGGIIGTNVSTFGGTSGSGNTLSITESYSTGNVLRNLATSAWYGNAGIIGVAYGASTTLTNVFSWGNINSTGIMQGVSTAGISGVGTATVTNAYTTNSKCGGTSTNCLVSQTAGAAVSGGTGFTSGLWQSVNGTSLVNLTPPTKNLYVQVVAPTDGSYGTMSYQIVDSTGTVQNLSSLSLSLSGTPLYTIDAASAKATYPNVAYVSNLTLGGSSAAVYSLSAWITNTSVTISKFPQTVTWAPTTDFVFGNGTITPSTSAVASGGTSITYSLTSAGTTGCTVNSSTGVITYLTSGTCEITATAANAGDYLAATKAVSFVIGAAPTLTLVASGGGVSGTDYTVSGGVLSATTNTSINASDLVTLLGTGSIQLAGNVVVNEPITWATNYILTLGGTTSNTVAINKQIAASGVSAGVVIKPANYSLDVKAGAAISLSGTSPTLSIGGSAYTLVKTIAELGTVTAAPGTRWALAAPLSYSTTLSASPIDLNFAGTFDGLGNTISNLKITYTGATSVGFFKNLAGGTVRNLGIIDETFSLEPATTTGNLFAGGLVGESTGGTIDQVWTTGFIRVKVGSTYSGLGIGGVVGNVTSGTLNISKTWSSVSQYAWASTFTNQFMGGIVGGDISTWTATSASASGTVVMNQVYFTGDLASPQTTGLQGIGGIVGLHTGAGALSVTDAFSWPQLSVNTGAAWGGIVGHAVGGTSAITNTYTSQAQAIPPADVATSTNTFASTSLGATAGLTVNANWYQSTNGTALVNLPMPSKNIYVRVVAPTDGSYGTMSYILSNGSAANYSALSGYSLSVSGTPIYSIDSSALIGSYSVTYSSGVTLGGAKAYLYNLKSYPYATAVSITKYAQSITLTSTAPTAAKVSETYTLQGSASSALAVAYTIDATSSSVCSIASGVVTFNAVGTCLVNANQAGNTSYLAAAQVQQTMTVAKGDQTVSITSTAPTGTSAGVGRTYAITGSATSALTPAFTIDAASSSVCSVSGSTVTLAAVGTCKVLANQAGNANWNAASQVFQSFTVGKGAQTISFTSTAPALAVVSGTTYTPTATVTGGGTITYTIDSASALVCSIAAGVVSFSTVGTCKVLANSAETANWSAATENFQSFTVSKGTPTLAFTSSATTPKVGGAYTPVASSASPVAVTYTIDATSSAICSITSGVVTFNAAGSCKVNADQASTTNWNAASQVQQTIVVAKGDQTITFTTTATTPKVGTNYIVAGTSTGSLAVTFSIDATSSAICTINGATVSFSAVGTCKVNADQAGNANWNAATQSQQSITVVKGDQTVSFSSTAEAPKVGANYTPTGTAASGLGAIITVNSGSSAICSISAGVVSFQAVGSCVLNINQAGNANWNAAPQVQQTISVAKGVSSVVITSVAPTNAVVGGTTYTLTSTKTAGNTNSVLYSVDATTSTICSVSGAVVSFLLVGTCKVNANLASDTQYEAATSQQQVITVAKGAQVLTFTSSAPNAAKVGGPTYTVTATGGASNSAVAISVDSSSTTKCSLSGFVVTFLAVGDCVLNLNQAADTNYNAAPQIQQTVTITSDGRCPNGVVAGNYCLMRFNTSGNWTVPSGVNAIDILAVGGGGAGAGGSAGNYSGGGGGGGEVLESLGVTVTPGQRFTATVGAGGVGGGAANVNSGSTSGSTSTVTASGFAGLSARGGGRGGGWNYDNTLGGGIGVEFAPGSGASIAGGGGAGGATATRSNTPGVGGVTTGGTSTYHDSNSALQTAGGGGGASGGGGNSTASAAGNGGTGKTSTILGTLLGGGGGGGKRSNASGSAGTATAGGGAGGLGVAGAAGTANTGGGGGGAGGSSNGGNGGSGVVVFRVALQSQTVSFSSVAPTGLVFGTATTYTPTATGTASEASPVISVDAASSSVCSISAGVVSITGAGTCMLNANQEANGFYSAATQAQQSFTVAKTSQTITYTNNPAVPRVGTTYAPTATTTSGGTVTYTIAAGSSAICSIASGVVTFNAVGICAILADSVATTNYNAASQLTKNVTVVKGNQSITFTSSAASPKVNTTYTPVATVTGGGTVTYAIATASTAFCSISAGVVSFSAVGSCVIEANSALTTNWNAATQNTQTITVTKGEQTISFTNNPASPKVNTTYIPVATVTGGGTVTYTIAAGSSSVCSITSGVVTFNAAGSCVILADSVATTNWNAATQATKTVTVLKGDQALTFTSSAPSAVVDGATYTPVATGGGSTSSVIYSINSANTSVCTIAGGVVSFLTAGTCEVRANQAGDANYVAATEISQTFTVGKGSQVVAITSTAPVNAAVDGVTYTLTSTSGASGNSVTYSIDSASASICSITGAVVSFLAAGTCDVRANQAGNANYLSATEEVQSIAVGQGTQVVSITSSAPTGAVVDGDSYTVATTGGASGNPVFLAIASGSASVCSLSGSSVSFIGVGECVIKANQNGTSNYFAATEVMQTFTVAKGAQVLAFTSTAPTDAVVDGSTYAVSATGGATNNAVVFSIDSSSSSVCSIAAGVVSFLAVGTCLVNANQDGNDNYNAAPVRSQSISVGKGSQSVAFTSSIPTGVRVGDSGYQPTATGGASTSLVEIQVASASTAICVLTNGSVSFNAAGDCVLEVTQVGDANYNAATKQTQTISVAKGLQTITQTNALPTNPVVDGASYTPTFTGGPSNSALTVSIATGSSTICEIANGEISFIGAGTCEYRVNQIGNDNYQAATEFLESFVVGKGSQLITISSTAPSDAVVGGATFTPVATGGVTGHPVIFRIDDSSVSACSISAGVVRFVGVGTCLIGATQSGDTNYESASDSISFSVGKGSQLITFTSTAPTTAVVAGAQYLPAATGGATANNVVFAIAIASAAVCELTAGKISFQTPGDCVIEANQAGNTNYKAAPLQTQTVSVGKGSQVLTFDSAAPSAARVGGTTYQPIVTAGPSTSSVAFSIAGASVNVCTVSNGVVSFNGVGDCVIQANQSGDSNYNAANQLTQTVSVAKGVQVVTFTSTPPSLRPVQGTTYTPTASSGGSGIGVVFTIAAEASSLCSISNGVISFQAVGDCVVYANQAGNVNWTAAPQVSQVFDITKGEQIVTITSLAPTDAVVGGNAYQPTATGGAGTKAVTYSISALTADICSATDGSISFQAAGVCLVIANQAGDTNYNAATPVIQSINVGKGSQTVSFSSVFIAARVEGAAYRPTATEGPSVSPARFTIASLSSAICEIVSGTVYFHAVGDCVIELNQDGDANYNPAMAVTQVISVAKGNQLPLVAQSSLTGLSLGETPPTTVIGVTGGSGTGAVTWTISPASQENCSLSGDVVTGLSLGYCDLVATKAGDDNFLAETAELAILVASGGQTPVRTSVNVANPVYEPGLELTLSLDGGNGLGAIWFESTTPEVCTVTESGTVSVLKGGSCSVVGHREGDESFIAAQDALTFTIARAEQSPLNIVLDRTLTYSPEGAVTGNLSVVGANSSAAPTFSVSSGTCELSGAELSATQAGSCVVSATVGQDDSYLAKTVERTITVAKAVPAALTSTVVAGEPSAIAWKGRSVTHFTVAGGSGTGSITATTTTANICTVSLTASVIEVTGLAQGTCVVSMNQATDTNYQLRQTTFNVSVLDLPSVPQNFTVNNTGANQDGSMAISVSWAAPATAATRAAVAGYEVQSKTGNGNWATVPNGDLDAAATSLTVTVPPWSQVFFRVAPKSALDASNGSNRDWITLTQGGTNVEVPFDVTGTLAAISTNLAATTSGETVTLSGTGFDSSITTRVQLSTASPVFAAGFGRAALAQTVVVPATVLSPTEIRFTLPKITLPAGRTSLATQVRILTANGISSQPVSLEYIPKKLAQTLALVGLPATKGTLTIGGAAVRGTTTVAVVGNPTRAGATPVVTATPANVCTASVVNNAVTVVPVGRGVCAISVVAPASPGFTASAAKAYSYTVKGATQALTFANPGAKTFSNSPQALTALSSALLPVAFSTTTPKTCAIVENALQMIAAGPCSVVANQAGSSTVEAAAKVIQTFAIAKASRSAGLTATADSISATGERTSQTYDMTSALAAPPVTVFVGENPLDVPVLLNKREGTLVFTVETSAEKAGICSAEAGEAGTLLASITMLDIGTCKVTISQPADAAWNAGSEIIVITVVGSALPDGSVDPAAANIGDAALAPEDTDTTVGDADTEPAVALNLDPTASKSYSFGGEDGFAYDPASGKINVKTRSVLVGTWTAILKSPSADKKWFKIKGKVVKKVQTYVNVSTCTTKLTVKKDPKLKKKVSRVIGAGCLLSDEGKAAFTAVGIQKIKMKYKRIRQYANTGLDYRGSSKAKTRILKNVNRTVVIKVGRTN